MVRQDLSFALRLLPGPKWRTIWGSAPAPCAHWTFNAVNLAQNACMAGLTLTHSLPDFQLKGRFQEHSECDSLFVVSG